MEENKKDPRTQYAHVLYRTKKYGTWQPCKIVIPPGTPFNGIRKFVEDDLKKQSITYTEMTIEKITN